MNTPPPTIEYLRSCVEIAEKCLDRARSHSARKKAARAIREARQKLSDAIADLETPPKN